MSPEPSDRDVAASTHVRVALVGCTGILGEIISKAMDEGPGIDVVARLDARDLIGQRAHDWEADLVLWNNADETLVSEWLRGVSSAPRVVATLGDGRNASLWELTPTRTELGALSQAELVDNIRTRKEPTWPSS